MNGNYRRGRLSERQLGSAKRRLLGGPGGGDGVAGSLDAFHDALNGHAKPVSEAHDGGETNCLLSAFYFPDLDGLHAAVASKLFRGKAVLLPQAFDLPAKLSSDTL